MKKSDASDEQIAHALRQSDDGTPADQVLPCVLGFCGLVFDIAAYYPGQMSLDGAYAWWQARGGESSDVQSPMLVQVWRICDALVHGPGPIFILNLLLFWIGLVLIALGLRLRPLATAALMLLVGLSPIALILRAHVWTDVGMLGALLIVTGALTFYMRTEHRGWLLLMLTMGFYALGLRHNALPALVPLVAFAVQRFLAHRYPSPTLLRIGAVSALVLAAMLGGVQAINARVDRHVPLWPALAEFDLAALSIARNQLLLPSYAVGDGMDVPDLEQAYRPWAVNTLLTNTRHGMRDPFMPGWTGSELTGLRRAWFAAIAANPTGYLAHRLAVSAALFGTHRREWPRELVFVDAQVPYRDNPPVTPNTGELHRMLMQAAEMLRDTPIFAAWPYLLIGLVAAPIAWRRRAQPPASTALVMLASAAMYTLPLVLLAPSADLRYLLWPVVAAVTGAVLAFAHTRSSHPEATRACRGVGPRPGRRRRSAARGLRPPLPTRGIPGPLAPPDRAALPRVTGWRERPGQLV